MVLQNLYIERYIMTATPLHREAMERHWHNSSSPKRFVDTETSFLKELLTASTDVMDKYIHQSKRGELKFICDFYMNYNVSNLRESTIPIGLIIKV